MKFKKIKNKYLNYAKSFDVSNNFVVNFSGSRAVLLNKDLEFVAEVNNLSHVYSGQISPNEQNLLLLPTNSDYYLIYSIKDGTLKKFKLKGNVHIQEDYGVWSDDGESVYVIATDKKSLKSSLQCYNLEDSFDEIISDKYHLHGIYYIGSLKKYLLISSDLDDSDKTVYRFIWYDEAIKKMEDFIVKNFDFLQGVAIHEESQSILLYGDYAKRIYDFFGNEKSCNLELKYCFQKHLDDIENEYSIKLRNFIETEVKDTTAFYYDKISNIAFLGSKKELLAFDVKLEKIIAKKAIACGVSHIIGLSQNKICVDTIHGTEFYFLE